MNPIQTQPTNNTAIFSAFDKLTGTQTPTATSGTPSRSAQIMAMMNRPTSSTSANTSNSNPLDSFGNTLEQGASNIENDISQTNAHSQAAGGTVGTDALSGLETAGNVAGDVAGTAGGLIGDAISPFLPDSVKSGLGDASKYITDKVSQIPGMTPEIQKGLGNLFNTITLAGGEAAEPAVKGAVSSAANTVADTAGDLSDKLGDAIHGTPAAQASSQAGDELQTIKDTITPKETATGNKIAMQEGRIIPGKDATLFKSGTPDQIATTAQQAKSAFTIHDQIPGAAQMDESTLHDALGNKIGEISKQLQPQMEKVAVSQPTIKNMVTEWGALKTKQLDEASATDEANIAKLQNQFESKYLLPKQNSTMADLWKNAKDYDNGVKSNVKSATSMSPEGLQMQKQVWLQNRAILRDAINDSVNGMGQTSSKAFSDMHDMYEGQNGILSKAGTIDKEGAPSGLSKIINSKGGKIAKGIAKGAGALYIGDQVVKNL